MPTITSPHTRGRHGLPPAVPIPSLLQSLACYVAPVEYFDWCSRHIGQRFTVYPVNMPPHVFLSAPDDIRAILTAPLTVLHAGRGASITAPLFGNGSFLLREEDEYLSVRNAITPAFDYRRVQTRVDLVSEQACQAISRWPLDTAISIHSRVSPLTMTLILGIIFGQQSDAVTMLRDRMLTMLAVTDSLVLQQPQVRHLPGWRRTWRLFVRHREDVDEQIATLIKERRSAPGRGQDVLGMLLEACRPDGQPMTNSELRDNLVSIIVAGHETTASTIAWALQLIAHHPAVQDRLADEITKNTNDQYLTATINEVLRHRPVFLFTPPRAVAQPIEINGWIYQPPVHLLGCTYLMHHNPILFADPHEFRPERFLESPPSQAWLPWGGGRKICPGRHLALLEITTILRAILSTHHVSPTANTIERARWRSALVTPSDGSKVVLNRRPCTNASRSQGDARPCAV
jgi:cytochrome P450